MAETAGAKLERLLDIMRTLRAPGGCPWDREQTLASLRPFVLEETYEVLEAIDGGDPAQLAEELGDFVFEAVFLAQISQEAGHFDFGDAIDAVADKLVRRHPHVFAPAAGDRAVTASEVVQRWEVLKERERAANGRPARRTTTLSGVPKTLPALLRAYEVSARAAAVGFDWVAPGDVIDKIDEEIAELRQEVAAQASGTDPTRVEEEMGDLLFAIANLSRKLGVEPESALRRATDKFSARFETMEGRLGARGRRLTEASLGEMEEEWGRVKSGQ